MRKLAVLCVCLAALGLSACISDLPSMPDDETSATPGIDAGSGTGDEGDGDEEPSSDPAEDEPAPPDPTTPMALVPGCTATANLAGYPTWFFYTRPDKPCTGTVGSGVDHHILNELVRLINSVPAGGSIDGHIFNITVDAVGKALLDAQTRGVTVRISTDGQVGRSTDTSKTTYLDKLAGVVYCDTSTATDACVSTADTGISHTKLFVFSHAKAPDMTESDNVVWFGSANQTITSGMKLYNNTVTVFGDAPLYTMLRSYLDDLRLRHRAADYYDPTSGRGHLLAQSADIYISPEATTDLVVNRLDDITPDANCRIKVMQASVRDSRLAVVDRLIAMKQGGCQIQVVAATVEPQALAALKAAKIAVRQMPIHDKSFVVYGKYGAAYQYRVYTGSHNLSGGALRRNDEIFVKLAAENDAAHPVYDHYLTHFNDAFSVGASL